MTKVSSIYNQFDVAILRRNSFDNRDVIVLRRIIYEDVLIALSAEVGHDVAHPQVDVFHIFFFVVTGRNDTNNFSRVAIHKRT